jgi:hypothetical protein
VLGTGAVVFSMAEPVRIFTVDHVGGVFGVIMKGTKGTVRNLAPTSPDRV